MMKGDDMKRFDVLQLILVPLAVFVGCDGSSADDATAQCEHDSDCADELVCHRGKCRQDAEASATGSGRNPSAAGTGGGGGSVSSATTGGWGGSRPGGPQVLSFG